MFIFYQKLTLTLLFVTSNSVSAAQEPTLLCLEQPEIQSLRAKELQELVIADQEERSNWENLSDEEKIKCSNTI